MISNAMLQRKLLRTNSRLVALGIFLVCTFPVSAIAQSALPVTPTPVLSSQTANASWASLNPAQQSALAPLAKSWESLSEGQKRKWIAISKGYPALTAPEKEKMHGRMVEWAALSPKDRELARLNFAQTKAVPKSDRAAEWEAYQALSPEEKQKLASTVTTKPVGAAVSPKPVSPDKLAAVPVTRHTPEEQRNAIKASQTAPSTKSEGNHVAPANEPAQPKS
jgi:hypothetical protein